MKLMISLSKASSPFGKFDRVVCKVDKNEWYLGTVIRTGAKLVVEFDDGHDADIDPSDYGDVKGVPGSTKPRKKFLTDAQAKKLYVELEKMQPKKSKPKVVEPSPPIHKTSNKDNSALDEKLKLLPKQQQRMANKQTSIQKYMIGDSVPDAWIAELSKRRSAEQPDVLYRLCVVEDSAVGRTISIKKPIASASDRMANAVFAGCSYILGDGGPGYNPNKKIALVRIVKPKTVLSLSELRAIAAINSHAAGIVDDEREYIIAGPTKGTVIAMMNNNLLSKYEYRKAMKFVRLKSYDAKQEQTLIQKLSAK